LHDLEHLPLGPEQAQAPFGQEYPKVAFLAAAFSDESAKPRAIRAKTPVTVSTFIAWNIEGSVTSWLFEGNNWSGQFCPEFDNG
jgi:hypothetical protein